MFQIENGREHFFQWDLNQRLIVTDQAVNEVHFCNKTDDCSLVCEVYTEGGVRLVNVPNILLQTAWTIRAYAYCDGCYTKQMKTFKVNARTKPADYAYTETEVRTWNELKDYTNQEIANAKKSLTTQINTKASTTYVKDEISKVENKIETVSNNTKHNAYDIAVIEKQLGIEQTTQTAGGAVYTIAIPKGAKKYAKIDKLVSAVGEIYVNGGAAISAVRNYPKRILNNKGEVLFELGNVSAINTFGYGETYSTYQGYSPHNSYENYGSHPITDEMRNYIFFENGRAYYHQGNAYRSYLEGSGSTGVTEPELGYAYDTYIVWALEQPIITDISDIVLSDGYIDIEGATSLTIEMKETEESLRNQSDIGSCTYRIPRTFITFEV